MNEADPLWGIALEVEDAQLVAEWVIWLVVKVKAAREIPVGKRAILGLVMVQNVQRIPCRGIVGDRGRRLLEAKDCRSRLQGRRPPVELPVKIALDGPIPAVGIDHPDLGCDWKDKQETQHELVPSGTDKPEHKRQDHKTGAQQRRQREPVGPASRADILADRPDWGRAHHEREES